VIARITRRLAIAWVLASACALAQVPGAGTLPAQDWREIRSVVEAQRAALVAGDASAPTATRRAASASSSATRTRS
jgi:hypothetical protein